jgi:sensor histidine kinase YesM
MRNTKQNTITETNSSLRQKFYYTNVVLNGFIFAFIGVFSYIYLTFVETHYETSLLFEYFSPWIFVSAVLFFVFIGYLLLRLNNILSPHYPYSYSGLGMFVLFAIVVFIVIFVYNYILQTLIKWGISEGAFDISMFYFVESRWSTLLVTTLIEITIVMLMMMNVSARFIVRLYREAEELRHFQQQAELKFLQNQLNPHFLFNSLNTLLSEIDEDPNRAKLFTSRLADVYRYNLHVQEKKTVPLADELQFLKSYVYVHQVRLGTGFTFITIIPKTMSLSQVQERRLPPLALQLLVENALKHNAVSERHPLTLKLEITDDAKYIVLSNNIIPRRSLRKSLIGGLRNLSKRYLLLSGQDIIISKKDGIFYAKIPLLDE